MTDTPADYVARRITVLAQVRELLVNQLQLRVKPDEIDPDTPLFGTGLGLDSIDAVDLVISLETDFGVKLSDERETVVRLRTVNTLVDAILAGRLHD